MIKLNFCHNSLRKRRKEKRDHQDTGEAWGTLITHKNTASAIIFCLYAKYQVSYLLKGQSTTLHCNGPLTGSWKEPEHLPMSKGQLSLRIQNTSKGVQSEPNRIFLQNPIWLTEFRWTHVGLCSYAGHYVLSSSSQTTLSVSTLTHPSDPAPWKHCSLGSELGWTTMWSPCWHLFPVWFTWLWSLNLVLKCWLQLTNMTNLREDNHGWDDWESGRLR